MEPKKRSENRRPPKVKRDSVLIGTDTATGKKLYLLRKWFDQRNWHMIGPPGEGKTRLLFHLYQCLCRIPRATVVVMNCKGALARMCRDDALSNGLTKRLVWFDPSAPIGYNPLRPNSLSIHQHAKAVRESIRAGWGQDSFDETPRLAKYLFLGLGIARMFELGMREALDILRPGARLRREILPRIPDPFFRDSLASLDAMSQTVQHERTESAITRLESFVGDPAIASMLTAPYSLDIGQVITQHKILLINLEIRRPLAVDDVRLLGRMLINDIASHIFADPGHDVYFVIDECHQFLTGDFCQLLDMGREVGAHLIAAHQNLDQLRQEDESRRIYGAVMKSARVKAIFGDCAAEDLDILLRDAMIDGYDDMKVKDELTSLELDPHESQREVTTSGWSVGMSLGKTSSTSSALSRGTSRSVSRQWGGSHAHSDGISLMHASGATTGTSNGETVLPDGQVIAVTSATEGASEMTTHGTTSIESFGEFQSQGEQTGTSEAKTEGTQSGNVVGLSGSYSRGKSIVPFYEYAKRRNVSSRTFETEQEYLTKCLQKAKAQPVGHFLLKLPKRPALFVRAPFVHEPWIGARQLNRNLDRVYAQPCYGTQVAPVPVPFSETSSPYQLPSPAVKSEQPTTKPDPDEDWSS